MFDLRKSMQHWIFNRLYKVSASVMEFTHLCASTVFFLKLFLQMHRTMFDQMPPVVDSFEDVMIW